MGWLFRNEKLRHETPAQFFTRMFPHTSGKQHTEVLNAAAVRGTIYAAIRDTDPETGASYVFCAVAPFRNNQREGFAYKSKDEMMGPDQVDCPENIIRHLSPIEDIPNASYSADWRARVAANKAARKSGAKRLGKLSPGDRIRLAAPAYFSKSGITADCFVLIAMHQRTPIFTPVAHPDVRCRLPRRTLELATVER